MAPPTSEQITTAIQALRTEAGVWDTESAEVGRMPPMAEKLKLDRVEAGLFQVVFDAYKQVIDQVIARTTEGAAQTAEIAKTLRSVADTYEREEAANVHRLNNIY
ncbi:hypothetical protein [Actinokineospora bangkokensis]|uniref:PE domain-containing protein n=1 Tax=Actinokineospora bangkokensis TaxID=1193682 RepID=A0A1Q9LHB3_9PSEU|nr:hypothetical protein [Actinokineospora bangkokensis]OLR91428.1 hypothetical protein BJP25_00905 [Actinokineospora bangkokensis]